MPLTAHYRENWLYLCSCSLTYFETSASTGQNVAKAVECLLNKVMLRIEAAIDKSNMFGTRLANNNEKGAASENSKCTC